jgi:hypothetical protein
MGQCSCGVLQSALNVVRLLSGGAELRFAEVCAFRDLFNTSVEMPVTNSQDGANEPVFMGFFPLCTVGGATLDLSVAAGSFGSRSYKFSLLGRWLNFNTFVEIRSEKPGEHLLLHCID